MLKIFLKSVFTNSLTENTNKAKYQYKASLSDIWQYNNKSPSCPPPNNKEVNLRQTSLYSVASSLSQSPPHRGVCTGAPGRPDSSSSALGSAGRPATSPQGLQWDRQDQEPRARLSWWSFCPVTDTRMEKTELQTKYCFQRLLLCTWPQNMNRLSKINGLAVIFQSTLTKFKHSKKIGSQKPFSSTKEE